EPFAFERRVRLRDGACRHTQVSGELTDRRQSGPCCEFPGSDAVGKLRSDLIEWRDRASRVDGDHVDRSTFVACSAIRVDAAIARNTHTMLATRTASPPNVRHRDST